MIAETLKDKSPDYIEGFLFGVQLFAWWQNAVQYVGHCGMTYQDVLESVNGVLNERSKPKESEESHEH